MYSTMGLSNTLHTIFNTFGAGELYLIHSPDCALVTAIISHVTTHYKIMLQHTVHLLQPCCLEKKRVLRSFTD